MSIDRIRITRLTIGTHGCCGVMSDADSGAQLAYTLEHTYDGAPKVPAGEYVADLGIHALHDGIPFQAYMLCNVPGHEGILIHSGNTEVDSEGCILIGSTRGVLEGLPAVLQSRECFERFMDATAGASRIFITVVDPQ